MFGHLQLFLKAFIDMPPTHFTMSTFQLDENDAPVTTHVDMGQIMFPRSGSETNNNAHHDTTTDGNHQTNGPTDGKPNGVQPCDSRPDDVQPDNTQTDNTPQGST